MIKKIIMNWVISYGRTKQKLKSMDQPHILSLYSLIFRKQHMTSEC